MTLALLTKLRCAAFGHDWLPAWGATDASGRHGLATCCRRCEEATFTPDAADVNGLRWRCDICGDVRPDNAIVVTSYELPLRWSTVTVGVRYCRDRIECRHGAAALLTDRLHLIADAGERSNSG